MTIYKIKAGRVPGANVDEFVADLGVIYYSEELGDLRIGDGVTPGGTSISGGGGGGGNYTLPTASTTVKGGVKVDGTTITIANQIISVANGVFSNESYANPNWITSLAYSKLTGTPTIPTNTNQLTNGSGYITSAALAGYATESYVTTRGYLTTVSYNDITGKPNFAVVATTGSYNDLSNRPTLFSGSYADLTNRPTLFTGSYADLTNKPNFAVVATTGSYNDLSNRPTLFSGSYVDLTGKPTIPTDINQLTDNSGLLNQGGGGGGTTYITNNVENPYTFNVAGDDSTLREISNGETLRFAGVSGITITSDAEGKITITGPDLSIYATQSYVTSQGYITNAALNGFATETYVTTRGYLTTVDWSIINNKPNFVTVATTGSYNDLVDKPSIPINTNQLTNGAEFITASALTGYATESYVTTRGYLTTVSWNQLTDKPNLAGTYSWNIAADDSTQRSVNSDNLIKFIGGTGIDTSSDADGNITINGFSGSYNDLTDKPTSSALNANGTLSMPLKSSEPAGKSAGQIALADGVNWDPLSKSSNQPYLTLYTGSAWIDLGGVSMDQVYQAILEMT